MKDSEGIVSWTFLVDEKLPSSLGVAGNTTSDPLDVSTTSATITATA